MSDSGNSQSTVVNSWIQWTSQHSSAREPSQARYISRVKRGWETSGQTRGSAHVLRTEDSLCDSCESGKCHCKFIALFVQNCLYVRCKQWVWPIHTIQGEKMMQTTGIYIIVHSHVLFNMRNLCCKLNCFRLRIFHMKIHCEKKQKRDWDFSIFYAQQAKQWSVLWGPSQEKSPSDCGEAGQQGSRSMLSAIFPQNWRGLRPWSCCVTLSYYILCHAAQKAVTSLRLLVSPAPQCQPRPQPAQLFYNMIKM